MSVSRHAGGLPAILLAAFALAGAAPADELPLPWFPPSVAESQATGLDVQLGEPAATEPATPPGAPDTVAADGVEPGPENIVEDAALVIDGAGESPLPVLSADADMSACARDLLRTRLATTVATDDILSAMALEAELLTLCRERQELVLTLHQVETALAELQGDGEEGDAEAPPLALLDQFAAPAAPPPEIVEEEPRPDETAADPPPPEDVLEEEPPPVLAWFSILGVKGALRAGITDGAQVWWVTEGAELPGGVTVASITGAPPAVVVAGDEITTLPWQRRPGGS